MQEHTIKILVVDDNRDVRETIVMVIEFILQQLDLAATTEQACDGQEALDMLKAASAQFDLIVSDVGMPNMTGIELLQALRAANITTPLGFIAAQDPAQQQEAAAAGATFFLEKPFDFDQMREAIAPHLPIPIPTAAAH